MAIAVAATMSLGGIAAAAGPGTYAQAVLGLNPDHYYRLNEDTVGVAVDEGTNPINGAHEGVFGPNPEVGDDLGEVGAAGPDRAADGSALVGFTRGNKALFGNNAGAVNLGDGKLFGNTTMTVATWFKAPCDPNDPGKECEGPPASSGGERIFTNNFDGEDTGGVSELDDLVHLQIDFGWVANLVISIDNRFSDPLKSNFQIANKSKDPEKGLSVKDNLWHHIVVSRNGDTLDNVILVVDGEEITHDRFVDSTDSWGITAPFDARIGTRTTAPNAQTFNGWLDETSIWLGRQLTVEEAKSLYQAALTGITGDMDRNGGVDFDDIGPFVLGLNDAVLYESNFGAPPVALGDTDGNGVFDFDDIDGFVNLLGTGASRSVVPEPTALSLLESAWPA